MKKFVGSSFALCGRMDRKLISEDALCTFSRKAASDPESVFEFEEGGSLVRAFVTECRAEQRKLRVQPARACSKRRRETRVRWLIFGAVFEGQALISGRGAELEVQFQSSLESACSRRHPRLSGFGDALRLRWRNEEGRTIEAPLRDYSAQGAAIRSTEIPGMSQPKASFDADLIHRERQIPCIVRVVRGEDERGTLGLALRAQSQNSTHLADVFFDEKYGALSPRESQPAGSVVDFMKESGYLGLREPSCSALSWERSSADVALNYDRVYRSASGTILGHVSVTKGYRRTWFMHQLAIRARHREAPMCSKSLYAFATALPSTVDPGAMVLGYYDPTKAWHARHCQGFVDWLGDDRAATVARMDRVELTEPDRAASPRAVAQVRDIRHAEVADVIATIRAELSPLAMDALDLSNGSFEEMVGGVRVGAPNERSRELRVVVDAAQTVVGTALIERGPKGLSLFNVFNSAHFFFSKEATIEHAEALMEHVLEAFQREGIERPLFITPESNLPASKVGRFAVQETMGCMIWTASSTRSFDDYLKLLYGKYLNLKTQKNQEAKRETYAQAS